MYRVAGLRLMVETNDFALLPELPLETEHDGTRLQNMQWKLIRDTDAHGPLARPLILTSTMLTVVAMGTACLLGLDHERPELLGFIGEDVDVPTYQEFLVPFLCRMMSELHPGTVKKNEESANA